MNTKLLGIVAAIVVAVAGVLVMGLGNSGPKPEDTFKLIEAAVEKKDVAEVEKYVDFDSLASSIARCDFIMGPEADSPDMAFFTSDFVGQASGALKKIVAAGNLNEGVSKAILVGDVLRELNQATGFRKWVYKGVAGGSKTDGDKAVVPVKVTDTSVDKDYTLEVDMTKENDVWRVKGVLNLNTLAVQRSLDAKAKLAELNKAIIEEIAKNIVISDAKMTHYADDSGFSMLLGNDRMKLSLILTNKSGKAVAQIYGTAIVFADAEEKPVLKYTFSMPYGKKLEPGKSISISDNKTTRGEDGTETSHIVKNLGSYKQKFAVTAVKFADGSELKLLNAVPVE